MGAWGYGPLENDAACDVLDAFFGDLFGPEKIAVLRGCFRFVDDYNSIRAGCCILQMLGSARTWPDGYEAELRELLDLGIRRLTDMLDPLDGDRDHIDGWVDPRALVRSVQEQLADLKQKRQLLD